MDKAIQTFKDRKDRRRERRFPIDSVLMPFLGTRSGDHAPFQYLVLDISLHGVKIGLPGWTVNRERLAPNTSVSLHAPFTLQDRPFNQGKTVWANWDRASNTQYCGIEMDQSAASSPEAVYFSFKGEQIIIDLENFGCRDDVLVKVLKDAYLLKKGVLIYLRHLVPYFSRSGKYPSEEYPRLREVFFNDVIHQVENHQRILESQCGDVREGCSYQNDIVKTLDLEELRQAMESEINADIFQAIFELESVMQYVNAIKQLEGRLYANYNTLVMLYIQSL